MPKDMTKEERAEYMRQYRARRKEIEQIVKVPPAAIGNPVDRAQEPTGNPRADDDLLAAPPDWKDRRIAELEEEVHRLKQELAKRPQAPTVNPYLGRGQNVDAVGKVVEYEPPRESNRPRATADQLSKKTFAKGRSHAEE